MLVYYKRIIGARNISEEDIPTYMDEFDQLEDVYFGKVKEDNRRKEQKMKGVYYYVNLGKIPTSPSQHIPYRLLVELASVAPEQNAEEYMEKRLTEYKAIRQIDSNVQSRIALARNWAKEFSLSETHIRLSEAERIAILQLSSIVGTMNDPQEIQGLIFNTARSLKIEPGDLFRALYRLLLGTDRGPRLGPYIRDIGSARVSEMLRHATEQPSMVGP